MFRELKEIISKELQVSMRMMSHQRENISKVIESIKRKKTNRNSEPEKNNSWNEKSTRGAEEIISKLEDRSIEMIQSEENEEKRVRKINRATEICDTINHTNISIMRIPERRKEKKGQKEYLMK